MVDSPKFDITLANTLPNGAVILERRKSKGACGGYTVLCHLPYNNVTPYVTWRVNENDGSACWGHYARTIDEAIADYRERL